MPVDGGSVLAAPAGPSEAIRGRGLALIRALCDEVRPDPAGNEIALVGRRPAE